MSEHQKSLLDMVKDAVVEHTSDNRQAGSDASRLLGRITDLFGKHAPEHTRVRPASEDPYGDPAGQGPSGKKVKPASEDPYGDPADQEPRRRSG